MSVSHQWTLIRYIMLRSEEKLQIGAFQDERARLQTWNVSDPAALRGDTMQGKRKSFSNLKFPLVCRRKTATKLDRSSSLRLGFMWFFFSFLEGNSYWIVLSLITQIKRHNEELCLQAKWTGGPIPRPRPQKKPKVNTHGSVWNN